MVSRTETKVAIEVELLSGDDLELVDLILVFLCYLSSFAEAVLHLRKPWASLRLR